MQWHSKQICMHLNILLEFITKFVIQSYGTTNCKTTVFHTLFNVSVWFSEITDPKSFEKGDEADSMYIIELGRVEINLDPNPPVIKDQGDFFGELGLVSNSPRNATITTLDEVKLLQLKKEDLEELIEEHPVIFKEIEKKISSYS